MRIISAKIHEIELPLRHPFVTGFGTIKNKPELIVELITDNGKHGYGESAILPRPIYTSEFLESCIIAQEKFIIPSILGKEFNSVEDFVRQYKYVIGHQIAKCGVECAFWSLIAEEKHTSLSRLLYGTRQSVEVGEAIGIVSSVDEIIKEVEAVVARGFHRIKLKIKPGWDEKPLKEIRNRWSNIILSVDCNASYDPKNHISFLANLERFDLNMIEQPFLGTDILSHAKLQALTKTPVCLDESIQSLDDLKIAVALEACKIVNIKPGRVGGLLESILIEKYASKHNIGVWCGGMMETGVGRAFNMALASRPAFIYPADMSPSGSIYKDDIVDFGLALRSDGKIDVSDKIGLGYRINSEKMKRYTKRTIVIH